jgi:hypothetical protein
LLRALPRAFVRCCASRHAAARAARAAVVAFARVPRARCYRYVCRRVPAVFVDVHTRVRAARKRRQTSAWREMAAAAWHGVRRAIVALENRRKKHLGNGGGGERWRRGSYGVDIL